MNKNLILEYRQIAILVLTQGNKYNFKLAQELKQNILSQVEKSEQVISFKKS